MKKIIYLLIVLVFIGCSDDSKKEEQNISEEIINPICKLMESSPCVSSSCIMLHATCIGGNVPIEEAFITMNNQYKPVEHSDYEIDDYVGFPNLQPNTAYIAELTVIIDGETIQESLMVNTRSASPILSCKTSHLVLFDPRTTNLSNGIILDLNELCTANGNVQYKIKSIGSVVGELYYTDGNIIKNYNLSDQLIIEGSKLKLLSVPSSGSGSGHVIVEAQLAGLKEEIKVGLSIQIVSPAKGL